MAQSNLYVCVATVTKELIKIKLKFTFSQLFAIMLFMLNVLETMLLNA